MRIGSVGLAANLSRLLLRPESTSAEPGKKVEAESGSLRTEAANQQQLLVNLQRRGAVGKLTQDERNRAYQAMEALSRQLLDDTAGSSIDLSL